MIDLAKELKENAYPGRGIVIGRSEDGKKAVVGYFIMGRSENSRNRVFVEEPDGIRTEAFDPSKMVDPSLIIYHPVRKVGDTLVVTNGDQTDTVADYYKQCSVYVLPSYREGTPRTVLEAMSMGRAVITTDAPGCRETVKNGETGFLVPVKDADALAEKMLAFVENPQWVAEMGAKSAAYCRQKFDVNTVNADMCSYLNIKGEKEHVLV